MADGGIEHYITKEPRLGPIDAKIVYPCILFLIHPRLITIYILLCMLAFLWFLSTKGISAKMFVRMIKRKVIGGRKTSYPEIRKSL